MGEKLGKFFQLMPHEIYGVAEAVKVLISSYETKQRILVWGEYDIYYTVAWDDYSGNIELKLLDFVLVQ